MGRELEKKQRNRKRQHLTQERTIRISNEKYERYDRKMKRAEDFRRKPGDEEDKENPSEEYPDEEYPDEEYPVDGEYPDEEYPDDEEYNDSYGEEKEKPKPKIPPTKSQLALPKAIERHNKNMGITKDEDSTSKKDKYGIPGSSSQSKSVIVRQNALNKIDVQNKRKANHMFQGEGDEL